MYDIFFIINIKYIILIKLRDSAQNIKYNNA